MRFRYSARHQLNYPATLLGIAPYLQSFVGNATAMARLMETSGADLAITDFEPLVAWGAKWAGIPFVSLDHQHFITVCDFRDLPAPLRMRVAIMAPFVSMYYSGQADTIVSGFAFPPLRKGVNAIQAGVLLRREILAAVPEHGSHITAYVRRITPDAVMNSLAECGREVRIYGLGQQPAYRNLRFKEINPHGFVEDLATGQALVTTAGNQLVGESLYLGKPVLAIPEAGNFEQQVNGHLLEKMGAGTTAAADRMTRNMVLDFLDQIQTFRSRIDRQRLYGNPLVMSVLNRYLERVPASTDALAA
jgi:uncharacterized protein (TIGR00661 family)